MYLVMGISLTGIMIGLAEERPDAGAMSFVVVFVFLFVVTVESVTVSVPVVLLLDDYDYLEYNTRNILHPYRRRHHLDLLIDVDDYDDRYYRRHFLSS